MGFLTKAEIMVLREEKRILVEMTRKFNELSAKFSGKKKHTGCCPIGFEFTGSGRRPCPCGNDDDEEITLDLAYIQTGTERAK